MLSIQEHLRDRYNSFNQCVHIFESIMHLLYAPRFQSLHVLFCYHLKRILLVHISNQLSAAYSHGGEASIVVVKETKFLSVSYKRD